MTLSNLIHKSKSVPVATLTVATQDAEAPPTVAKVASVTVANSEILKVTAYDVGQDDRRYCRQCLNLNSTGYCIAERFRPTDDMPRRCTKFKSNGEPAPLGRLEEEAIRAWLAEIGEDDQDVIAETLERCRNDLEARRYFLMRAEESAIANLAKPSIHHCQECQHWKRNTIGDGSGIGICLIDAPRRGLPWPNQDACNQFQGANHD